MKSTQESARLADEIGQHRIAIHALEQTMAGGSLGPSEMARYVRVVRQHEMKIRVLGKQLRQIYEEHRAALPPIVKGRIVR